MAYLLSQIFFSLVLAAIFGAAIGWILHGYKASQREAMLRDAMDRQGMVLAQAESDRQMISDDFDELKVHLESRIGELQNENRQIPQLSENLDKSQSLVRQMIQRHDSEIHELQLENSKLASTVDSLRQHERDLESEVSALRKVQAGSKLDLSSPSGSSVSSNVATSSAINPGNNGQSRSAVVSDSQTPAAITDPEPLTSHFGDDDADQSMPDDVFDTLTDFSGEFEVDDHFTSLEVDSEADIDSSVSVNTSDVASKIIKDTQPPADNRRDIQYDQTQYLAQADLPGIEDSAVDSSTPVSAKSETSVSGSALPTGSVDGTRLFTGSEVVDNLQTIHGIGPVIEQSLNDLGITSFQQIAHLSRKEIQEIADVLQIFPGRIERDNWVGSAKKLVSREELEEA